MKKIVCFLSALILSGSTAFSETGENEATFPPPVSLTNIIVGDSSCRIEWTSAKDIAGFNAYIRQDEGTFLKLNDAPIKDNRIKIVDLINGKPYRFGITAVSGEGRESEVSVTGLAVPIGFSHSVLSLKGGARAADYRLISVPFEPVDNRPEKVFAYFPSYETSLWRLFSFGRDGYREFGQMASIEPGKGYWFLSRDDTELFLSGRTTNVFEPFRIRLHPGWNIIGSPFLFPVAWEDVLAHNMAMAGGGGNVIWEFAGGGFKKSGKMEPFKGYYVYNGFKGDVDLLVPPIPMNPKIISETAANAGANIKLKNGIFSGKAEGSYLKISATDSIYSDADNVIGIDPTAWNKDIDVSREPPAWPQHLSLYFVRSENGESRRSTDIRNSPGEWIAFVEGGENGSVTLNWEKIGNKLNAELIDSVLQTAVDMGKSDSYTFARADNSPRKFVIRIIN